MRFRYVAITSVRDARRWELSADYTREGDVLLVSRTGERVEVQQVRGASGQGVDVRRGVGGTTRIPVRDGDELVVMPAETSDAQG